MSIRPLPPHVAEKIKSSVLITSLNDVVSGLVKNSLDAEAKTINVSVDYAKATCSVEDDGLGVPPQEFRVDGGLGRSHHTSKLDALLECHGSNGDFLAAVAALSLLAVASRHHQYHSHNAVGFHNSQVLYRNTPAQPEQRLLTFGHGTRVSVRDLFGSMPVRVKQRPGQGDRPAIEKEWRRLVLHIVGLVLAWREPVTIRVREATSGLEIRLHPPQPRPGSTLSTTDSRDLVSRVSRGLSQAGLSDAADAGSWDRVSASGGGLSIKGCISLNPVASRRSQFVCLGITPIPSELGARILYDEVNRVFSSSSFAALEDGATGTELSQTQVSTTGGPASSQRPKRGVDRFPMFFLQVNATRKANPLHRSLDQLLAQTHRVDSVLQLLKTVCYDFLQKHHFSPRMPGRAVSLEGLPSHRGREETWGSVSNRSGLSTATTRASRKPGALSRSAAGAPTAFGRQESTVNGGSGDTPPLLTSTLHPSTTTQSPSSSILLIIDQHAADERIRLEALVRAYFSPPLPFRPSHRPHRTATRPHPVRGIPRRRRPPPPLPRAPSQLGARVRRHRSRSRSRTPSRPDSRDDAQAQVSVLALPLGIFERCSQEPPLLIDLLRAEAWKLDERPPPSVPFPDLGASAPSDPICLQK
ncbi:unnamed protein product [Parascedosporium putredinis]|uniref:MutL C-terminal dimerisation domain-containing protein n=1 Tax=Parascedosporium putredinis TaxID=1442378 RepID=A0A9P1H8G1_9PEZI|nr:unnamed protein product [Parascedosporium putredinis]CAI7999758.1 unnamed protein product [Parascedosporium putredinis]